MFTRRFQPPAAVHVVALTGLAVGLQGVVALVTAKWLGAADRGVLVVGITATSVLLLIAGLGVASSGRVLLASDRYGLAPRSFLKLTTRLLAGSGPTSTLVAVAILAWLGNVRGTALLLAYAAYCLTALPATIGREGLHGVGRHRTAICTDLIPAASQLAGSSILFLEHSLTVSAVFLLGALGQTVQAAFAWWMLWNIGDRESSRPALSLTELVAFSRPALIGAVGSAFVWKGDRLLLGMVSTPSAVGVYGTAATLADLSWIIPLGTSVILTRRVAASQSLAGVDRWRRLTLLATAVTAVGSGTFATIILTRFLGGAFMSGVAATWILCCAAVVLAHNQINVATCQGLGDFHTGSVAAIVGSLALILAALPLSYLYGPSGCAAASFIAYSVMALLSHRGLARHRLALAMSTDESRVAP